MSKYVCMSTGVCDYLLPFGTLGIYVYIVYGLCSSLGRMLTGISVRKKRIGKVEMED